MRRLRIDTEPPRDVRYRIIALGNLGHGMTLALITEISLPIVTSCYKN